MVYKFDMNVIDNIYVEARYNVLGNDSHLGKLHTHDGFEILHIVTGTGTTIVGNMSYDFCPGAIFLINGSNHHSSTPDNITNYKRNSIIFSPRFILSILEYLKCTYLLTDYYLVANNSCGYFLTEETSNQVDALFKEIVKDSKAIERYRLVLMSMQLIKILLIVDQNKHQTATKTSQNSYKNTLSIIEYIDKNLKDYSLGEMSRELFLTKSHLCHCFKNATSMSIGEYLNSRRIAMAKYYLISSNKSISQIASEVGFSSYSIFSRSFKEIEKVTPTTFRKQKKMVE